ncbi:MAG: radical SAM family heme chaperone HemW [Planctomycetaceae bacterium]|nr:radical SAM family heme chaperone HemW [Planctomycetaceae bacterium]
MKHPIHLEQPRSTYIHVPFCVHRCGYCDFTLVAGKDHLIHNYLEALSRELADLRAWGNFASSQPLSLDTLYFGGGTPTHLSPEELRRLFEIVFEYFSLDENAEFTVEANPVDLTEEKIAVLVEAGVNRLSLGVQSFEESALKLLERDHTRETIHDAMNRLRGRLDNVSLDLIFAVPGQSRKDWKATLAEAADLHATHLSTYCLTFEKGTSFYQRLQQGKLSSADEELQREMYADVMTFLPQRGYEQYEISSFAKPGFRSRHNQVYWSGRGYFGFGPGAARYLAGVRETNHRSVTTWLKKVAAGESGAQEREQLSDEDRARERLILGLRTLDGVNLTTFADETGFLMEELCGSEIEKLIAAGHLERDARRLRLTHDGRFFADSVTLELL